MARRRTLITRRIDVIERPGPRLRPAPVRRPEFRRCDIVHGRSHSVTGVRPANHYTSARFPACGCRRGLSPLCRSRGPLCALKSRFGTDCRRSPRTSAWTNDQQPVIRGGHAMSSTKFATCSSDMAAASTTQGPGHIGGRARPRPGTGSGLPTSPQLTMPKASGRGAGRPPFPACSNEVMYIPYQWTYNRYYIRFLPCPQPE